MIHVEDERIQIIETQTREISLKIDNMIVANAFTIINVMGVKRENERDEALVQDILTHLNLSMEGLSAAKVAFATSVRLIMAMMNG